MDLLAYIKYHLKENYLNVNFEILSKKDAYLERIVHGKNVKFVDKSLVNAIITLPTETISKWEKLLDCEIIDWSKYFIIRRSPDSKPKKYSFLSKIKFL
jgi:hypothetical protein